MFVLFVRRKNKCSAIREKEFSIVITAKYLSNVSEVNILRYCYGRKFPFSRIASKSFVWLFVVPVDF